jgi:hypothetical protein
VHHRRQFTLRFCEVSFVGVAMLWVSLAPPVAAQIIDDFEDGDDAGWTRYDPIGSAAGGAQNTWTFPNHSYRLQAAATPNPALGPGRVASLRPDQSSTSFQVAVDLVAWNDIFTQAMGLIARVQPNPGLATTDAYVFGYVSGALGRYAQIVRVRHEATSGIPGSTPMPITLDPTKRYRFFFQGHGDQLEGRIYELPNVQEPILTLKAVDGTYTEGTAGLIAFSLNRTVPEAVDATFDNYYGLDTVPPTLEVVDLGFGLIHVRWPGEASAFRLECADSLPAASWTAIDEGKIEYFADLDRYVYQHDASTGSKFFRLHR